MEDFLASCVDRYRQLTGVTTLRKACTPFLPEPTKPDFSDAAANLDLDRMFEDAHKALTSVIDGPGDSSDSTGRNFTPFGGDTDVPTQLAPYAA